MKFWALTLLVGLLLGLQSCAQPSGSGKKNGLPLSAEVLRNTAHCGDYVSAPAVIWIQQPEELKRLYAGFPGMQPHTPPSVDFANEGVLLIAMGQRPTAGYGLGFEPGSVQLVDSTLRITVAWQEPAPGYLQAQVVTHPCVLLKLPIVPFRHIQVLDSDGRMRLQTSR